MIDHSITGQDACEFLSQELNFRGVHADCLDPKSGSQTIMTASADVFRSLIVFLTDETLTQGHVALAVKIALELKKKILCVYEGDFRRKGAVSVDGGWDIGRITCHTLKFRLHFFSSRFS